jgi:threonine synthase
MNENLTADRPTFVTHLECSLTGEHYAADELHNLSRAGGHCWSATISPRLARH